MSRSGYRCTFKDYNSVSSGKMGLKETFFQFPKDPEKYVFIIYYKLRLNTVCVLSYCN